MLRARTPVRLVAAWRCWGFWSCTCGLRRSTRPRSRRTRSSRSSACVFQGVGGGWVGGEGGQAQSQTQSPAIRALDCRPWPYDRGWRRNLQEVFGRDRCARKGGPNARQPLVQEARCSHVLTALPPPPHPPPLRRRLLLLPMHAPDHRRSQLDASLNFTILRGSSADAPEQQAHGNGASGSAGAGSTSLPGQGARSSSGFDGIHALTDVERVPV